MKKDGFIMNREKETTLGGDNLTLLTDFYELTMANGFLADGRGDQIAYFDMFFRKIPDGGRPGDHGRR